ncbi:hypothetical protein [Neisseria sp.]|uniref:hypothetical protein n=1 Tax=Neisseria sp. TaxID=192066 RepID=UPI00359F3B99
MKEQYLALTEIVNRNLKTHNLDEIIFERFEGMSFNIFAYPKQILLDIQDDETFLREAYYKILDREIDKPAFNNLSSQLKEKKINKAQILDILYSSRERAIKKTQLVG